MALIGIAVLGLAAYVIGSSGEEQPEVLVKSGNVERPAPLSTVGRGEDAEVRFETSEGSFVVDLATETAPLAADNFAYLAQSGFYDGLGFHRIVPGFVIQGGDPRGDGSGGPGYRLTEPPPVGTVYSPRTVAMAKSAAEPKGSFGSQFFIVTSTDALTLPADYALVGTVGSGFGTVKEIGELGGANEVPTETVVIEDASLVRGSAR